jgi:hypothetical protein
MIDYSRYNHCPINTYRIHSKRKYIDTHLNKELEILPPLADSKEQQFINKTQDLVKEIYDGFQDDKRTKQSLAKELLLPKADDYYLFDWKTAFLVYSLT